MDGGTIGVMSLIVVNIAVAAYSYGRLSQKVNDLCRRMDRVEKIINNPGPSSFPKGKEGK